jgi:hypothetical protein
VFSNEDLDKIKELIAQLSPVNPKQQHNSAQEKGAKKNRACHNNGKVRHKIEDPKNPGDGSNQTSSFNLLPSELLVIAGIICNVLKVDSVLINRNQGVEILLTGSMKRTTQLEKIMQQIGKMPFDQVMRAILENSTSD